MATLIWYISRY